MSLAALSASDYPDIEACARYIDGGRIERCEIVLAEASIYPLVRRKLLSPWRRVLERRKPLFPGSVDSSSRDIIDRDSLYSSEARIYEPTSSGSNNLGVGAGLRRGGGADGKTRRIMRRCEEGQPMGWALSLPSAGAAALQFSHPPFFVPSLALPFNVI
jgi:hypothetical protein